MIHPQAIAARPRSGNSDLGSSPLTFELKALPHSIFKEYCGWFASRDMSLCIEMHMHSLGDVVHAWCVLTDMDNSISLVSRGRQTIKAGWTNIGNKLIVHYHGFYWVCISEMCHWMKWH